MVRVGCQRFFEGYPIEIKSQLNGQRKTGKSCAWWIFLAGTAPKVSLTAMNLSASKGILSGRKMHQGVFALSLHQIRNKSSFLTIESHSDLFCCQLVEK
jgi:hypothetical protein